MLHDSRQTFLVHGHTHVTEVEGTLGERAPTCTSPLPPALKTLLHPCSLALFILSNFWGKKNKQNTISTT